jgi:putative hemolysin
MVKEKILPACRSPSSDTSLNVSGACHHVVLTTADDNVHCLWAGGSSMHYTTTNCIFHVVAVLPQSLQWSALQRICISIANTER